VLASQEFLAYQTDTSGTGDNLWTNGTEPAQNPDAQVITYENGTATFPWGMEWTYPCKMFIVYEKGIN